MIKNIIFDIGGVVFDDKNNNLINKFNITKEKATEITTIAFTDNFIDCMLGKVSVENYIEKMKLKYPDIKEELEYLLDPKYYYETFPLKEDIYKKIIDLYNKGYNLYILSNNTEASFKYVSSKINLNYFKGIVSSFTEHIIKPNIEIYDLILKRYNLNKEETIFFDDSKTNVSAANSIGLRSVLFTTLEDIEKSLD